MFSLAQKSTNEQISLFVLPTFSWEKLSDKPVSYTQWSKLQRFFSYSLSPTTSCWLFRWSLLFFKHRHHHAKSGERRISWLKQFHGCTTAIKFINTSLFMKSMRFLVTIAAYCAAHVHIINTRKWSRTVMAIMILVSSVVMQKINNQAYQFIWSLTRR